MLTMAELATKLAKSPAWLADRLSLANLPDKVAPLVDEGRIGLSNAYVLAKLSQQAPEEVDGFLERAMTMTPQQFVPTVTARIKEIKDLKRQGRSTESKEFIPPTHLRKLGEIKEELTSMKIGQTLVRELQVKTPAEAFALALKWVVHQDPKSIEAAKVKEEERKKQDAIDSEKRKVEREKKKQEDAQARLADITKVA